MRTHRLTIFGTRPHRKVGEPERWYAKWSCSCELGDWVHTTTLNDTSELAKQMARVDHSLHSARVAEHGAVVVKIDQEHSKLF